MGHAWLVHCRETLRDYFIDAEWLVGMIDQVIIGVTIFVVINYSFCVSVNEVFSLR